MIIEGTGEELATAEEFFIGNGYTFIDAKTRTSQEGIRQYVGELKPFHRENIPSIYARTKDSIMNFGQRVREHFGKHGEIYGGISTLMGLILGAYLFVSIIRASGDDEHRGALTIMKDDIFGRAAGKK